MLIYLASKDHTTTVSRALTEQELKIAACAFNCRNHAWVSFQGFTESFNDTFDLPSEHGTYYRSQDVHYC